jgi:hypothetical protein
MNPLLMNISYMHYKTFFTYTDVQWKSMGNGKDFRLLAVPSETFLSES